jgi:hypothetical protein
MSRPLSIPGTKRSRSGALFALALGGVAAPGCVDPDPYRGPEIDFNDSAVELTIDSGARVAPEAGAGVGVSLEYTGEGRWWLYTSCDFVSTGTACVFDVLIFADESATGISDVEDAELAGSELEPNDDVYQTDDVTLALEFSTEDDLDGVGFSAEPGETVRVSALLYDPDQGSDGGWSDDPRLISWVGNGGLHWGAPTNPVELRPDLP